MGFSEIWYTMLHEMNGRGEHIMNSHKEHKEHREGNEGSGLYGLYDLYGQNLKSWIRLKIVIPLTGTFRK